MKVWVTAYALTKGVLVGKMKVPFSPGVWVSVLGFRVAMKCGVDVFDTPDAAVADARARRDKRIASLRKQIAKLEKFEPKAPDAP